LSFILRNIKFHMFLAYVIIKGLRNKKLFLQHNLPAKQNIETGWRQIFWIHILRICFNILYIELSLLDNLDNRVMQLKSHASSLNLTSYYTCVYEPTEG
jgi:hypothetical protein